MGYGYNPYLDYPIEPDDFDCETHLGEPHEWILEDFDYFCKICGKLKGGDQE
jgi:hypothetical protein